MRSFIEYIKENNLEGTPSADMRMNRPHEYINRETTVNLINQLQNPKNKDAIAKVLADHPEMAEELHKMIKDALMHSGNIDYYRMSGDTYQGIDQSADSTADDMVQKFK